MKRKKLLGSMVAFCLLTITLTQSSYIFVEKKFRRIIFEEYPGGTILPKKIKNEKISTKLYDGRYLEIFIYDYKGKSHVRCFSKDSILLEEGNYINSMGVFRKYTYGYSNNEKDVSVHIIEYYSPLRNGKWMIYNSLGNLKDSSFYIKGVKVR